MISSTTLIIPFNFQVCMSEIAFCAFFSCTHNINTPFNKCIKALTRVFLVETPVSLYKGFQLSKELFNWIQVWWIGWQIYQDNLCIRVLLTSAQYAQSDGKRRCPWLRRTLAQAISRNVEEAARQNPQTCKHRLSLGKPEKEQCHPGHMQAGFDIVDRGGIETPELVSHSVETIPSV